MTIISAAEFIERNIVPVPFQIIDVREELEYQTFNLGGDNIPLGRLLTEVDDLAYDKDLEIIVICQHGLRSETARRILTNLGFNQVRNLAGGLVAIRKLNL